MKLPCQIENLIRFFFPKFNLNCGSNVTISRDVFFDKSQSVIFGNNIFVNRKCQFHNGYGNSQIVIDDWVWIGMDVCFICVTHEIGTGQKRAGKNIYKDITIGKGTWIGARSTILPGVTIGSGAIIAAGSVVAKTVGDNELWGGCQLN